MIGSLAVELGGIVRHRKEDAQQLAVGDLGGIVDYFDRLGMAGGLGGHLIVGGGRSGAAGISCGGLEHAFDPLKNRLRAPEAAAGKHRGLLACLRGQGCIYVGGRYGSLQLALGGAGEE